MERDKKNKQRNNLGESLELSDLLKRLGVTRLELYLGRKPGEV